MDTPYGLNERMWFTMGFVLAVLFFVLTFALSPWWLLPLGAVLFGDGNWVLVTIIIVLGITVSPWWFLLFLIYLLA